mmetsp:Transcript_20696/g.34145  ORF Transcript_20696/g.34145 Transcript_20696/m.34145 type:complete len:125 (+) Transcript_20696:788-1162(+)
MTQGVVSIQVYKCGASTCADTKHQRQPKGCLTGLQVVVFTEQSARGVNLVWPLMHHNQNACLHGFNGHRDQVSIRLNGKWGCKLRSSKQVFNSRQLVKAKHLTVGSLVLVWETLHKRFNLGIYY